MNLFLVDGNSLGYAAQSTQKLTSADGTETQAIFQTLKMVKHLRERFDQYDRMIVLWDDRAQFRYDLYPKYKGKRNDDPAKVAMKEAYQAQIPALKSLLTSLGIEQMSAKGFEADDVVGFLCRKFANKNCKIKMITGDQDWLQLVSTRVSWHDPRSSPGRDCNRVTFQNFTGCNSAREFLEVKALTGDTSDCITGVGGIGDKAAAAIISNYGGVVPLFKERQKVGEFNKDNLPEDLRRFKKKLNDFTTPKGLGLFRRNIQLMDLMTPARDSQIQANLERTYAGKNMQLFEDRCAEFNFQSIIRDTPAWSALF